MEIDLWKSWRYREGKFDLQLQAFVTVYMVFTATESEVDDPEPQVLPENRVNRGRKRGMRTPRGGSTAPSKRGRRISSSVEIPLLPPPEPQPPPRVEQEKPDANMCLKVLLVRKNKNKGE